MAWTTIGPVSTETRLNRIYPEADKEGHLPFVWHIQTQFPNYVATGSKWYIRSQISEKMPPY